MTEAAEEKTTKAGFVAIIGTPNVGKSTLVNALVGQKVTIMSRKAQTTRSCVRGILMVDDSQIVLIDTPGIFKPKRHFDRAIVHAAWDGAGQADIIVMLLDATRGIGIEEERILKNLARENKKVDFILNKIDLLPRASLLALAQKVQDTGLCNHLFMISALKKDGLEEFKRSIAHRLPLSPFLYDPEDVTDLPIKLFSAEITREKIFHLLHDELPYDCTVETEKLEVFKNKSLKIHQTIYVKRENQRRIFLGKGGITIKRSGQMAREELCTLLERSVHLFLFVKVREHWQQDPERYQVWGTEMLKQGSGDQQDDDDI